MVKHTEKKFQIRNNFLKERAADGIELLAKRRRERKRDWRRLRGRRLDRRSRKQQQQQHQQQE